VSVIADAVKQCPATPDSKSHHAFDVCLFLGLLDSTGLSSFLLRLFIGLVATDGTPGRSTHHTVPASNVTRNAAYCRSFQATFGLRSLRKEGKATHQSEGKK
jgi:hypothetical protein